MPKNRKEDQQSFIRRNLTEVILSSFIGMVAVILMVTYNTSVSAGDKAEASMIKANSVEQNVENMAQTVKDQREVLESIRDIAQSMKESVAVLAETHKKDAEFDKERHVAINDRLTRLEQ